MSDFGGKGDLSCSESNEPDKLSEIDFKSIKTVSDGGLYAWAQQQVSSIGIHEPAAGAGPPLSCGPASPDASKPVIDSKKNLQSSIDLARELTSIGASFNHHSHRISLDDFFHDLSVQSAFTRIVESTGAAIRLAFVQSAFSKSPFLPLNSLAALVNQGTITQLLRLALPNTSAEDFDNYIEQVCGPALPGTGRRKIFAILVLIDRIDSIRDFIRLDIRDHHLPLEVQWDQYKKRYRLRNTHRAGNLFRGWSFNDIEAFSANQARMQAPFFRLEHDKVCFYKLREHDNLPFIVYEPVTNGGYGRVLKVKIHEAHHNFFSPNTVFCLLDLGCS